MQLKGQGTSQQSVSLENEDVLQVAQAVPEDGICFIWRDKTGQKQFILDIPWPAVQRMIESLHRVTREETAASSSLN